MAKEYRKREEGNELIKRFEDHLRKKKAEFFDLDAYEQIIDHYMLRSKHNKALQAVNQAISQYPFSIELITVKAQILSNLEEYGQALELLHHAHSLQPNDPEIFLTKGSILSLQGNHLEAIENYEKALLLADDKDEVYYSIGLAYQSMDDYQNAIEAYKKSIEININHEGSLYELAFCLDVTGQLESSIEYYQKFIDEDPYSTAAWYNLGIVYNKLEKYSEALQAYDYAITIDETFASAYFNTGNTYMNMGEYTKALDSFRKTLEIEGPSPEVYCCLGAAYESLEQYDLGLKYFQKATKLDSLYDEAWFGAGACLEKQEKWYQALHFYNKALKINTENAEYWKSVAHAEFKVGNTVSSIDAYEEASKLEPDDKEIWLNWSFIYYEQGDHEKAIETLSIGFDEIPDDPEIFYRMTVYLIEAGRFKEAFNYLENALILDFDGHTALFDFFPKIETQKALYKIIEQFEKEKQLMNYDIKNLPERTTKPRQYGFTMAMDKGLSIREAEDFVSLSAHYVDIVKLGWGTSFVTPNLKDKIKVYKDAGLPVYFGGTLFEAFVIRDQFDEYRKILDKFEMTFAEVSDGSMDIDHDKKCDYITKLTEQVTVLSEVGSKDADKIIPPYMWIELMQKELDAGAWKVIGEARESGNVGLFRSTGEVRSGLVQEILTKIPFEKIIWEAPQKAQQVWFVKLLGANVNLGNIAPEEIIPLETIRLGLRGDTFLHFLGIERKNTNTAPPFEVD